MNNIKSEIQKQLDLNRALAIEISGISEMDITFLQILLKLEGASPNISFHMPPESKKKVCEFMKSYGYHKELNI